MIDILIRLQPRTVEDEYVSSWKPRIQDWRVDHSVAAVTSTREVREKNTEPW